MSERFQKSINKTLVDTKNNKGYFYASECADLLNSLVDENEHLKEYLGDIEADVKLVESENEQLRQELAEQYALHSNWIIRKDNFEEQILKENEQLQKKLERLQKILHIVEVNCDE